MWKTAFEAKGDERKRLVKALEEATGEKAQYQGAPSFAYQVGGYTVTKEGNLEFENELAETEATEHVYAVLAEAGFTTGLEDEPAEELTEPEDPTSVLISMPLRQHTGDSLRNLINLLYTRADLLNKALGTSFRVDKELVERLNAEPNYTPVERMLSIIGEYDKALEGLLLEDGKIAFCGLPETGDLAKVHAFATICGMMNKQALESKRILAKEITEPNEKYSLRIWLTRLGMNGPEYKEDRAILMQNLSGHVAFHTPADQERWTKRQAEKRAVLKEAKAAAQESEVANDENA